MLNSRAENFLINDPVPKNVSKFPIHQTYLTDDAERTGTGGYKFKAPEVWSSARSGKKSIAIRSIDWMPKSTVIALGISILTSAPSTYENGFKHQAVVSPFMNIYEVITNIVNTFNTWSSTYSKNLVLNYQFNNRTNHLEFNLWNTTGTTNYKFRFTDSSDVNNPSTTLNNLLNQPADYFPDYSYYPKFDNVWDRTTPLNFHASFVPFDNYQYLGTVLDKWQTPIIYQDPNTSPLFNVWITTDMKTPIKLLYESFIIRISFIISSESQYHS